MTDFALFFPSDDMTSGESIRQFAAAAADLVEIQSRAKVQSNPPQQVMHAVH